MIYVHVNIYIKYIKLSIEREVNIVSGVMDAVVSSRFKSRLLMKLLYLLFLEMIHKKPTVNESIFLVIIKIFSNPDGSVLFCCCACFRRRFILSL